MTPQARVEHEVLTSAALRPKPPHLRLVTILPTQANDPLVMMETAAEKRAMREILATAVRPAPELPWPDQVGHKAFLEALHAYRKEGP